MNKTSEKAADAFFTYKNRIISNNTKIDCYNVEPVMVLFGNVIAKRLGMTMILNDCGWRSVTTKSRLNSLLGRARTPLYIQQSKGVWFLRNPINGTTTEWKYNQDNIIQL